MKYLLASFVFVCLTMPAIAAQKKSEPKREPASRIRVDTIYIKSGKAVSHCMNKFCDYDGDYIQTVELFGMSEKVDAVIYQLDYSKLYSCESKGGRVGSFYKVYEVKDCKELNAREFLEKVSDKFGEQPTPGGF